MSSQHPETERIVRYLVTGSDWRVEPNEIVGEYVRFKDYQKAEQRALGAEAREKQRVDVLSALNVYRDVSLEDAVEIASQWAETRSERDALLSEVASLKAQLSAPVPEVDDVMRLAGEFALACKKGDADLADKSSVVSPREVWKAEWAARDALESAVAALARGRAEALADCCRVMEALGYGIDEDVWPSGTHFTDAVSALRSKAVEANDLAERRLVLARGMADFVEHWYTQFAGHRPNECASPFPVYGSERVDRLAGLTERDREFCREAICVLSKHGFKSKEEQGQIQALSSQLAASQRTVAELQATQVKLNTNTTSRLMLDAAESEVVDLRRTVAELRERVVELEARR